jgi:hypothetical protein
MELLFSFDLLEDHRPRVEFPSPLGAHQGESEIA